MLTQEEILKIQQLSEQNPDVDYIIKRLNEESKFMISKISHEIRNPLTLISSTLQIMELKNPDISKIKYWSQIRSDVGDLILLLNDLSTYNNCDKLNISSINLSNLIYDIADSFESASLESNNKISICIHESAINTIRAFPCDKIKLKQVFVNIIQNAFEAMDAGDSLAISLRIASAKGLTSATDSTSAHVTFKDFSMDDTPLKIASLGDMDTDSDNLDDDSYGEDTYHNSSILNPSYTNDPTYENDPFYKSCNNDMTYHNAININHSYSTNFSNKNNITDKNNVTDSLIITISNNGSPIPFEHLDTLFEPFVTHKSTGTGLGLAISEKIIKSHGGSITVQSTEELTSFVISLPILQ